MNKESVVSFGLILRRNEHPEFKLLVGPEDHHDPWSWIKVNLEDAARYQSKTTRSALAFVNIPQEEALTVVRILNNISRSIENGTARNHMRWETTPFPAQDQDQGRLVFAGLHMRRAN